MTHTVNDLVVITEDSGEPVIIGFKPIADIIDALEASKIVLYLSYPGGLRLQAAIYKFKEAANIVERELDEGEVADDEIGHHDPEELMTEAEKNLIYAAYLMS